MTVPARARDHALLEVRQYSKEEIVSKSQTQNLRIILDGQQRITSVYRALCGMDAVYVVMREELGLEELMKEPLETVLGEVRGEESLEAVSVLISDAYRTEAEDLEEDDLNALFSRSAFGQSLTADSDRLQAQARIYRKTVRKLCDLFKKQKLVTFHLLDMTLDKFCLFFERSNSRGIQLNFTDILAAKLYHGFNLRQAIEDFEGQHGLRLNRETIVRTIAYMNCIESNKPIRIDKKVILESLDADDFHRNWDRACDSYRLCLDYLLNQHFILNRDWLPSENMVVPLMVFLSHVKGFDRIHEAQRKFLEFWYWSSVFANRYSTSSNEVIISDSQALSLVARNRRVERRDYFTRLRSLVTDPDDLLTYTKRTSAIYRGVLNLIGFAAHGLRDWRSTQKIDANRPLDDHHIYPKAYLSSAVMLDMESAESAQLADCVVNRTLIPKNLNVTVGKRPPQTYLSDLKKLNPNLEASLLDHLVPPEIVSDPSWNRTYRKFLDFRARAMLGLIEQYVLEPAKEMEARHAAASKGWKRPARTRPGVLREGFGRLSPNFSYRS